MAHSGVIMTVIKKPKTIRLSVILDQDLYDTARVLCGLTNSDIRDMIADVGLSGLSNYCNAQENWIDDQE
jgi:hypothetical protein